MINPSEWLRSRKNLLEQVKSQVQLRLGPPPRPLRQYAKNLDKDFAGTWRPCRKQDLRQALSRARVVLSADFHAYSQSQRAHLRVLREFVRGPVVLVMECLPPSGEKAAAEFLRGELSEDEFLKEIDWEKNWGFPWENYRPLFLRAREQGWILKGLNQGTEGSLARRDEWMARRIKAWEKEHPKALIYVIVGEWHLAQQHLPKKLGALGRDRVVVLFQDIERLYFNLARRQQEHAVEWLRGGKNKFCFMVSPPWMKWQSYLMYLEQAYDKDLDGETAVDPSDHVVRLIEVLEREFKLKTNKSRLQVYGPQSKSALNRLRKGLPKRMHSALVYYVEHDLSFFLPEKDWLYLSRATINHASALAGQYVHAHLCHRQRTLWNVPDDFLPLLWSEAVGFFFSKWINPNRKAESLQSLQLQLSAFHPEDKGREALLLALDHRLTEVIFIKTGRLRRKRFRPRNRSAYWDASRLLGGMLGERLYQKVRSRTIRLTQLMSYLRRDIESDRFADFYWRMVADLERDQTV